MRYTLYTMVLLGSLLFLWSCGGSSNADEVVPAPGSGNFTPYTIVDSSDVISYENGVKVYMVNEGPGRFPHQSMSILMDYQGYLEDGSIFDSSFDRGEALRVTLGQGQIIPGLEYAVQKMRFGTKAIVVVPPAVAYQDRTDVPGIPPNATLSFHIDVLGAF